MSKSYKKIRDEIMNGLENSYCVTVEFMSKTIPLKITINKQAPLDLLFERIKFIIKFYEYILDAKIGKVIVNFNCVTLETHIFVKMKHGYEEE